MSGFQLDTSGVVARLECQSISGQRPFGRWSDLTPFAQGYIEAMAAECAVKCTAVTLRNMCFSDLAPATLARIIGDCERWSEVASYRWHLINPRDVAAALWREQQAGNWAHMGFPPLTPHLGEDGLIYLREAA